MTRRASLRDRLAARAPQGSPLLRQAVVSTVNSDGTVDLVVAGEATTIPGVLVLSGDVPFAGATAWCLQVPGDILVVGVQTPAGSDWITSTTGFTLASNWNTLAVKYRVFGPFAELQLSANRINSAITVAAGSGNIGDVDICSAVPARLIPAQTAYGHNYDGRVASFHLGTGGVLRLTAVAGDGTNVAIGESVYARFFYPLV